MYKEQSSHAYKVQGTLVYHVQNTLVYKVQSTLVYHAQNTLVYQVQSTLVYQVLYLVQCTICSRKRVSRAEQQAGQMKGNLGRKVDQLPRFANLLRFLVAKIIILVWIQN